MRKKERKYKFTVCYIYLIYHVWFSALIPVDSIYHLVWFPYFNTVLLPSISFVLFCQIYQIAVYYSPNNTITSILKNTIAFKIS